MRPSRVPCLQSLCLHLLGLLILHVNCLAAETAVAPRQHLVLIVADDLRCDLLQVYGGSIPTPHLSRLAARGCLFNRATCGYPICHVSRTELLTGRSVVVEAATGKAVPFHPDWAIWPQVMQDSGWRTVHVGKWHVAGTPWTCGYEETAGLFSSGGAPRLPLTHAVSATGRAVTGYTGWTFKTPGNQPQPEHGIGLTPQTDLLIARAAITPFKDTPVHSRYSCMSISRLRTIRCSGPRNEPSPYNPLT